MTELGQALRPGVDVGVEVAPVMLATCTVDAVDPAPEPPGDQQHPPPGDGAVERLQSSTA